MVPRTRAEKSEAGEQQWRRENAELSFFYTLTRAACIYADTGFLYFNRSPIAIKQRNPQAQQRAQVTEMLNVVPQKSLRAKTTFYIQENTGSTEFFALTLLSFALSQGNEEKR